MTLYKRILLGVLFISFCLIGLIFINAQLILVDSYQHLEEQNATQNIDGVFHVLQSDLDNLRISDIDWLEKPPPIRSAPLTSNREFVQETLLTKLSLDAKLSIALLLDGQNHVIFQNALSPNNGKPVSMPKALLGSARPGSPLLDSA